MDMIQNISLEKTKLKTEAKAEIMADIREAVEEIKLVKQGKLASRDIGELLDELKERAKKSNLDIENGDIYTHNEVVKISENW